MAKERAEEIRKLVEQNPGLTAQQITQKFPQSFEGKNDQSEMALLEQLVSDEQQTRKASLEEDDVVASVKMPATLSVAQVKTMIINDLGGKPLKDSNEYKFGLTGYVKMSTSFDPAGNLSGVKGNNYQAMAQTLSKAGANNISVEGSPYKAYRMFRASVENGLNVTNLTINKSLPITSHAWSYDSRKSASDNREALQKAFSFIPGNELDRLIDKLEKNRENIALKAAAGKSVNDEKAEVSQSELAAAGVEAALLPENPIVANDEMVITSNAELKSTNRLQEILGNASGFTAEVFQETGRLISRGSQGTQFSQLDAHISAGATQLYLNGKRMSPEDMSITMRQARSDNFDSPAGEFKGDAVAAFLDNINTKREGLGIPSQLMTADDIEREMKSPDSLISSTMAEISRMVVLVELRGQMLYQLHELEQMIKETSASKLAATDQSNVMQVNPDISPDEKAMLAQLAEELKKQEEALRNLLDQKTGLLIDIESINQKINAQNTLATKQVSGAVAANLGLTVSGQNQSALHKILSGSPMQSAAQVTELMHPVMAQILSENPTSAHAQGYQAASDKPAYLNDLMEKAGVRGFVEEHVAARADLDVALKKAHESVETLDRSIGVVEKSIRGHLSQVTDLVSNKTVESEQSSTQKHA